MVSSLRSVRVLVAFAGVALVAGTAVWATGSHGTGSHESGMPPESLPPGSAHMRAYLDPETGNLQVRAGEPGMPNLDPKTRQALRRDEQGLVPVHHPDGSVSIHLQGRFQSATVARLDETGTVFLCTETPEGVTAGLRTATPAEVQ